MTSRLSLVLAALVVPLLLAGLAALYVKVELAESDAFADRAVDALRSKEVRAVIAEQVTVESSSAARPSWSRRARWCSPRSEADEFERVLRGASVAAHDVLLRGDGDVVVELEKAAEVLVPAVQSTSPEVARQISTDLSPRIAELRGTGEDRAEPAEHLRPAERTLAVRSPKSRSGLVRSRGGRAASPHGLSDRAALRPLESGSLRPRRASARRRTG